MLVNAITVCAVYVCLFKKLLPVLYSAVSKLTSHIIDCKTDGANSSKVDVIF